MRFGTVAILGRANVGKSTFLNAALGEPLAIISPTPQTTRDNLLGVVTSADAQLAFVDTPGIHRPRSELGRRMNAAALEAARTTDVLLFMTEVGPSLAERRRETLTVEPERLVNSEDRAILEAIPADLPTLLVVNKIDRVRDKARLLPLLQAYGALREFSAIVPTSLLRNQGVERVLDALAELVPESPTPGYAPDTLTDRPVNFFVREYVRESVLQLAGREVPHAVAVSVERMDEVERRAPQGTDERRKGPSAATPPGPSLEPQRLTRIAATIHVEKEGQRRILVGAGGSAIREIGTRARHRIEELLGHQVYLELFVRVSARWRSVPRQLSELGYEAGATVEARFDAEAVPQTAERAPDPDAPETGRTERGIP